MGIEIEREGPENDRSDDRRPEPVSPAGRRPTSSVGASGRAVQRWGLAVAGESDSDGPPAGRLASIPRGIHDLDVTPQLRNVEEQAAKVGRVRPATHVARAANRNGGVRARLGSTAQRQADGAVPADAEVKADSAPSQPAELSADSAVVEVVSAEKFAMNGEPHTLTAVFDGTDLDVVIASYPAKILKKISAQILKIETDTSGAPPPTYLGDLKTLETAVAKRIADGKAASTQKRKDLVTAGETSKISAEMKILGDAMLVDVRNLLTAIANKHVGMEDFVYDAFELKPLVDSIVNVLDNSLEKHVGLGKSGDGHACSAYAAEYVLGWYANQGVKVPQLHKTKVEESKSSLEASYNVLKEYRDVHNMDQLAKIKHTDKFGIELPIIDKAKEAIDWCTECMTNPEAFLRGHSHGGKTVYELFANEVADRLLNDAVTVTSVIALGIELGNPTSVRAKQ